MSLGRIPAQCVENLSGELHTLSSHDPVSNGVDNKDENNTCQPLPWPNYCNHLPKAPKFFVIPSKHKQRSKVIQETLRCLENAYFDPQSKLSSLQNHVETTGNQVKSPRREAAISILKVMLYYQDDSTGRVGRKLPDGGFKDLSIKQIASYAGLRLKRAKRALWDIMAAGYMKVVRQYYRAANGDIINLPSVREFLPKFYMELDVKGKLWQGWFWLKNWKKEREAKKEAKVDKKSAQAMMGLIKETVKSVGAKGSSVMNKIGGLVNKASIQKAPSAKRMEHERQLRNKALELFNLDPSKNPSDYYRELLKKYPPPP